MVRLNGSLTARCLLVSLVSIVAIGCAASPTHLTNAMSSYPSQLPEPDLQLNIAGLGSCSDDPDRALRLNSHSPVTILVHGCFGSAGSFRTLSQVLAFHGQQTACFSYDDRESMMRSSRKLADAIEQLSDQLPAQSITLIGHSQGGLISRKALVSDRDDPISTQAQIELVTISAPLSGIRAAKRCANMLLRIATLGIHDLLCWFISGDKWYEITTASDFIKNPGTLNQNVMRYLLVATDEQGSCRRYDQSGQCIEEDFVFTLNEQELPLAHSGIPPRKVEVRAGHVEIVGEFTKAPEKLIGVLQQEGFIRPTPPARIPQFNALLKQLYGKQSPKNTQRLNY